MWAVWQRLPGEEDLVDRVPLISFSLLWIRALLKLLLVSFVLGLVAALQMQFNPPDLPQDVFIAAAVDMRLPLGERTREQPVVILFGDIELRSTA